ncbi:MAG: hypothetical protein Ct9H90mP6_03940 [Gammaproteobacteria bacterium]|nr:MAG: hypothetical protein Ct9H90mP6_03940 [Gammaproteobacteria bacterium]
MQLQIKEERYGLLGEAEKILIDELPIIPVYTYVRSKSAFS